MTVLRPGDFFCTTQSSNFLARSIRFFEKLWAKDNEATYSHSGIITDDLGTTLEALTTIRGNVLDAYIGQKILIGRWSGMDESKFWSGMDAIKDDIGKIYPFWRLPLFIIPGAAKWISSGKFTVCSELVCKFLMGAGYKAIGDWKGQNPDDVADMISHYRDIEIIYDGIWKGEM